MKRSRPPYLLNLVLALIGAVALVLTSAFEVKADNHLSGSGQNIAVAPSVIHAVVAKAIKVTGTCEGRVMIFKFKNTGRRWVSRGFIAVRNGVTEKLLARRQLRFAANQSATFRVGPKMNTSGRYLVDIRQPDGKGVRRVYNGACETQPKPN